MKASEAIAILQELIATEGDQELVVDCPGMMGARGIQEIDLTTESEICIWPERNIP